MQRVDAIEIGAGERVLCCEVDRLLEQGHGIGRIAARIANASAFQEMANANARRLINVFFQCIERDIGFGKFALQPQRTGNLRRRLPRLA